ncbi:MAG TPA: alpha-glucan family phosphorylase [Chloroflexia bacterium]|nr:alpha-glucan family phosphorylase [Chloroflexia bacterium]
MNIIQPRVTVSPIPPRLSRLPELAYNLWWSWHPHALALFSDLDPLLWDSVYHSPVRFLNEVRQRTLDAAAADPAYLARYDAVLAHFDTYMSDTSHWFNSTYPDLKGPVAYFSFEFGLHESLPIYSGGLGVLAGDHVKGASDLGVPIVFVGFLYPQGYFRQLIDPSGWQEAVYNKLDFEDQPVLPAMTPDGREVIVEIDLPQRTIYAKVYKFQVGRSPLYMLDTDIHPNAPADRQLSSRLYGGDQEMRIAQELVLGIGGIRALRALGIDPAAYHMNEGHAAFLILELAREHVDRGLPFAEALTRVARHTIFTTHTPVAAGNDAFPFDLMDKFFSAYYPHLGITRDEFLSLAREGQPWGPAFSMTALALKGSDYRNGVSKLHGRVSRNMWHWLWPNRPVEDVPIASITNGVHTGTWLAPELHSLYTKYLGDAWYDHVDDPSTWLPLYDLPDSELWEIHVALRHSMVDFARRRLAAWYERTGQQPPADPMLDPDALTFGFARRFATYKRATLLFSDTDRLIDIINRAGRPAQFIFAGKAHPRDEPGKQFIQQVFGASRHAGLAGKVVFLEEYDMNVARYLVQGVDVWLNNPRRPYEASGTSGMKAALNGQPNLSVLDGWWAEAYNGKNGWAIGQGQEFGNPDEQDWRDVESLYQLLEHEVIPRFYDRGPEGYSPDWVRMMKEAIVSVAPTFSMARQVKEYTSYFYVPAMRSE